VEANQQRSFNSTAWLVSIMIAIASGALYYYFASEPTQPMVTDSIESDTDDLLYPIHKVIRYSFLLKNTSNQLIKQADFKAYAPVEKTASQHTKSIKASEKFELTRDPLGNQVMDFTINELPPYGSKVITITAEISLSEQPNSLDEKNLSDYLQQEPFIEISEPQIQALATRLSTSKHDAISQSVFDWVSKHIDYAGYVSSDQGALYALQQGKGDCTEYMYLSTALLRANDIPARGMGGFVVSENSVLSASDYHNWTEYYQDEQWHLLDAQKQVLDTQYQDYISFRVFGQKGQNALSQSQRFLAYDPRLEVRMN